MLHRRRLPISAVLLVLGLGMTGMAACGSTPSAPVATSRTPGTTVPDDGLSPIGEGLRGPAGLHATTYASGLANQAAMAVDPQGRLWVSTAAFNDDGTDRVYLVPSAGAAPVEVITDVHTPLGLLWYQDALYVAAKEAVTAYRGFDGSRFASHAVVVTFPAGSGEVNGLALGPDGRMHLGISAPCDSCAPDLEVSGSVVSFRPDGTDLQVDAKAIRAPVGLTFYPGTADLFVTMNQQDDLGDRTPGDLLSVVAAGQDWKFPACPGQGGTACDGVPRPVAVLDPHAAVSGVAIATGELGGTVGTAAIVAEWATGSVLQVPLADGAATRGASPKPFLTGIAKPEPVLLAPDGALFVGDWKTGTVYRISSA